MTDEVHDIEEEWVCKKCQIGNYITHRNFSQRREDDGLNAKNAMVRLG